MVVVAICETFGWTYDQYQAQPLPFIELIKDKMRVDAQKAEVEASKAKRIH